MKIDIDKLVRIPTFAILYGEKHRQRGEKGNPVSRQHIDRLMKQKKIPDKYIVTIDDTIFINIDVLDELPIL